MRTSTGTRFSTPTFTGSTSFSSPRPSSYGNYGRRLAIFLQTMMFGNPGTTAYARTASGIERSSPLSRVAKEANERGLEGSGEANLSRPRGRTGRAAGACGVGLHQEHSLGGAGEAIPPPRPSRAREVDPAGPLRRQEGAQALAGRGRRAQRPSAHRGDGLLALRRRHERASQAARASRDA